MSDQKERLAESLSALMDGETSEIELHRILKEVGIDQDQETTENSAQSGRRVWQRYHMISASMAGEPVSKLTIPLLFPRPLIKREPTESAC